MSDKKTGCGCMTLAGLAILAFILAALISTNSTTTQPDPIKTTPRAANPHLNLTSPSNPPPLKIPKSTWKPDLDDVYFYAIKAVRENLKSPSGAKFSSRGWDAEARITPYGYRQWLCAGWVESQNSFGARLREKWGAYVYYTEAEVSVDYIEVGDSASGKLPPPIPFPKTPEEIAAAKADQAAAQANAIAKRKVDDANLLKWQNEQAAVGSASALLMLGDRYRTGTGVDKNLVTARDFYQKAADAGSYSAKEELSKLPK